MIHNLAPQATRVRLRPNGTEEIVKRKVPTITILVFVISLPLYSALPSPALTVQGKDQNARGRQLYTTYCASCHGVDGKGGGPAASALKAPLSDLTKIASKNSGKFPAEHVLRVISGEDVIEGHGSREMPVWGDYFRRTRDASVSRMNIYALTKYIESIQAK